MTLNPINSQEHISFYSQNHTHIEDFKERLRNLSVFSMSNSDIETSFLHNLPNDLDLETVYDFIFKECHRDVILLLLKVLSNHDSSMSPYNKLRESIVQDIDHNLTNEDFHQRLKQIPDLTDQQIQDCYDLARMSNHPNIYKPAKEPVNSHEYTLNFLWINLNPQDRIEDTAQNIFGDGLNLLEGSEYVMDPQKFLPFQRSSSTDCSDENQFAETVKKVQECFTYRLLKWAQEHRQATIHVWYDSALVTRLAQVNTFNMLNNIAKKTQTIIHMKDLRMLPSIKYDKELEGFFHPSLPVYFRVDLLKKLIPCSFINTDQDSPVKYAIISDIDVEPMSPSKIFDQCTLDFLNIKNYVFNIGYKFFIENSFMIFNNSHATLFLESFHELFVQLRKRAEGCHEFKSESVFVQVPLFLNHLGEKWVREPTQTPTGSGHRWKVLSNRAELPRKATSHPISQFVKASELPLTAHPKEQCFFSTGDSALPPHVRYGRNYNEEAPRAYAPMKSLANWLPDPLLSP